MPRLRVETGNAWSPVLVDYDRDRDDIDLRIGDVLRGQTRYAPITPRQAVVIASYLLRAALAKSSDS